MIPPVRPPKIELTGIGRRYGRGPEAVPALDRIDLTLEPGEFVSVEGPSGCGKTTLLNLVGLLDVPTAGDLRWDGSPTSSWREPERARRRLSDIGFIFQRFYLLPTLTATENVELPLRAAGRPAAERRGRAHDLLDRVGLSRRRDAYPHELSGGEEQRVAIARALANRPGLLLADEPTGELDSANTDSILDLLDGIHRESGASVVVVTHNPRVARRARRHLTMADGRLADDRRDA